MSSGKTPRARRALLARYLPSERARSLITAMNKFAVGTGRSEAVT